MFQSKSFWFTFQYLGKWYICLSSFFRLVGPTTKACAVSEEDNNNADCCVDADGGDADDDDDEGEGGGVGSHGVSRCFLWSRCCGASSPAIEPGGQVEPGKHPPAGH